MCPVTSLENREIHLGGSDNHSPVYVFPVVFMRTCVNKHHSDGALRMLSATCVYHLCHNYVRNNFRKNVVNSFLGLERGFEKKVRFR